jgi:hypothetical protein
MTFQPVPQELNTAIKEAFKSNLLPYSSGFELGFLRLSRSKIASQTTSVLE